MGIFRDHTSSLPQTSGAVERQAAVINCAVLGAKQKGHGVARKVDSPSRAFYDVCPNPENDSLHCEDCLILTIKSRNNRMSQARR